MYRKLATGDVAAYRMLRLAGLQECPTAFGSSFAEESKLSTHDLAKPLAPAQDGCLIGAFSDGELVGVVGIQQQRPLKMRHKAFIWGMYVTPEHRGEGIGRGLLTQALEFAALLGGVTQTTLCVVRDNEAASALYRNAGFVTYGTEPRALKVENRLYDELLMVRFLDPTHRD